MDGALQPWMRFDGLRCDRDVGAVAPVMNSVFPSSDVIG